MDQPREIWGALLTSHLSPFFTGGKITISSSKWGWMTTAHVSVHPSSVRPRLLLAVGSLLTPHGKWSGPPQGSLKDQLLNHEWVWGTKKPTMTSGPSCFLKSRFTKYKTNIFISVQPSWMFFLLIMKLKEEWLSSQLTPNTEKLLNY